MLDHAAAADIAERYVTGLSDDAGVELAVLQHQTVEQGFGWVFFYGPKDASAIVAGNAPFIVDRSLGSIHPTGTAYPLETYIRTYAATGRTFPPGLPEHTVVIEGWARGNPRIEKIPLTKLIRGARGYTLAEAKACTDEVVEGRDVVFMFSTDTFCQKARGLGASVRCECR